MNGKERKMRYAAGTERLEVTLYRGIRAVLTAAILAAALIFLYSCGQDEHEAVVYRAELSPLNTDVTGMEASGTATLRVVGDSLTIMVEASGLPPGMMHLQHYHGFKDGSDANCPGMEQAGNDGIIDLLDTEPVSGVTLVPFHGDPASLKIKSDTYPSADENGRLSYSRTVSLAELASALLEEHGIQEPAFERRVVYIHGISPEDSLPASVKSLAGVPAHVTLPIACGKLRIVK